MLKTRVSLVDGPLFPNIIRYTIPIILANLLQMLFNAADMVVVGRFCGGLSVAAVGSTSFVSGLFINFFIGLSAGVSVVVASAIGAKDDTVVHRAVHTALPTALLGGILLAIAGFCLSETLLIWIDTPADVLPYATQYMRIIFCGVPFLVVYNFLSAILRAAGDTKSPFIFLTTAGVLNVILNVIFVTVFKLNVVGVALATIISQAVSATLTLIALTRRNDACHLWLSQLRIYPAQLKKILCLGIPAGIQSILFSLSNTFIQSCINGFGSVVMAGHAAAQNIDGLLTTIISAFNLTAINFVSQNAGAKQYRRVKQTFILCTVCCMSLSAIVGFIAYSFGPQLLSIYITDSPEAIGYGMVYLTYVVLANALFAFMWVPTGALRGIGASTTTMLLTLFGVICRVGWLLTVFQIPRFHTLSVIYLSYGTSWFVIGACQVIAFIVLYKRQKRAICGSETTD